MKNQLNNSKTKMQYSFGHANRFPDLATRYQSNHSDPSLPPNSMISPICGKKRELPSATETKSISENCPQPSPQLQTRIVFEVFQKKEKTKE